MDNEDVRQLMTLLTIDEILAASCIKSKIIDVPAWGGAVKVKDMTKREQQLLRRQATNLATGEIDADRLEILMLAHCIEEPKLTLEQVEKLADKSAAAFDTVLRAIMTITGLSEGAQMAIEKTFRGGDI